MQGLRSTRRRVGNAGPHGSSQPAEALGAEARWHIALRCDPEMVRSMVFRSRLLHYGTKTNTMFIRQHVIAQPVFCLLLRRGDCLMRRLFMNLNVSLQHVWKQFQVPHGRVVRADVVLVPIACGACHGIGEAAGRVAERLVFRRVRSQHLQVRYRARDFDPVLTGPDLRQHTGCRRWV